MFLSIHHLRNIVLTVVVSTVMIVPGAAWLLSGNYGYLFGRAYDWLCIIPGFVLAVGLTGSALMWWNLAREGAKIHRMRPAPGQIGLRVTHTGMTAADGTVRWRPEVRHGQVVALWNADGEIAYHVTHFSHPLDDRVSMRGIAVTDPDGALLGDVLNTLDHAGRRYVVRDGRGVPRIQLDGSPVGGGLRFTADAHYGGARLGLVQTISATKRAFGMVAISAGVPEPLTVLCALLALESDYLMSRLPTK